MEVLAETSQKIMVFVLVVLPFLRFLRGDTPENNKKTCLKYSVPYRLAHNYPNNAIESRNSIIHLYLGHETTDQTKHIDASNDGSETDSFLISTVWLSRWRSMRARNYLKFTKEHLLDARAGYRPLFFGLGSGRVLDLRARVGSGLKVRVRVGPAFFGLRAKWNIFFRFYCSFMKKNYCWQCCQTGKTGKQNTENSLLFPSLQTTKNPKSKFKWQNSVQFVYFSKDILRAQSPSGLLSGFGFLRACHFRAYFRAFGFGPKPESTPSCNCCCWAKEESQQDRQQQHWPTIPPLPAGHQVNLLVSCLAVAGLIHCFCSSTVNI